LAKRLVDNPLRFARLRLRARAPISPAQSLDPVADGVRPLVLDPGGTPILDAVLAPSDGSSGWRPRGSSRWTYVDRDGSSGIRHLTLDRRADAGLVTVTVKARGDFPGNETGGAYRAIVVFGDQSAAAAGRCGESDFAPLVDCRFAESRRRLTCSP